MLAEKTLHQTYTRSPTTQLYVYATTYHTTISGKAEMNRGFDAAISI